VIIASIVEGDGEVAALPLLLRRMGQWLTPENHVEIPKPIRVRRDRFLNKDEEFRRMVLLAADKCGINGWLLILLDADDDCPAELGRQIQLRARNIAPDRKISVVLANREYEAWFIASAKSLNGQRGFSMTTGDIADAERIRDAKNWLSSRIRDGKYRETTDQPAFSSLMDMQQAKDNSRSFLKLCMEWQKHIIL
jgi:chorismate mutase